MSTIIIRPTFFWKLMHWWVQIFIGRKNNIQTGTIFYGGMIYVVMFFERPGERLVVAQTCMNKEQAKHFHEEMGKQIERMEAFS